MLRIRATRLLALGGILLLGFLYWKPMHTYLHAKHQLQVRRADVHNLRVEKSRLERQIAAADSPLELAREARRLGMVKPGEQLYIVRGISTWRKHH